MGSRNVTQLQAHKESQAKYQAAHPDRYREQWKKARQRKRNFIEEVVGTVCVECFDGRNHIIEYHHPTVGGGQMKGLFDRSWAALKEEAMRLIPLCGTCHNIAHGGR